MKRLRPLLVAACVAAVACGQAPEQSTGAAPVATGADPGAAGVAAEAVASAELADPVPSAGDVARPDVLAPEPGLRRLRGHAIMGKDGYGVTPCGESQQRIVDFGPDAKVALDRFLASGAREFFVDGWTSPAPGDRPTVTRIERIYSEGPGCEEALSGVMAVARGNEPFWAVRAGIDGVVLERPDAPVVRGVFAGLSAVDGGRELATETDAGRLSLRLVSGLCSDGMSDTVYGWSATVTLGGETLRGCGFVGMAAD